MSEDNNNQETQEQEPKRYKRKPRYRKPRKKSILCTTCGIRWSGTKTCHKCRKLIKNNKRIMEREHLWHRIELLEDKTQQPIPAAIQNPQGQWFCKIKNINEFLDILKETGMAAIVRENNEKLFIQLVRN